MIDSRRDRRIWRTGGLVAVAAILAFCGAALLMLVLAGGEGDLPPIGYLAGIVVFTLEQAALSTVFSVLLAMPVALSVGRRPRFFGRSLVLGLMALPLGLPVLPAVFGLIEIWGQRGLVNRGLEGLGLDGFSIYGLSGIVLAHVFFNLPLAARLMTRALAAVPDDEWRLAASLGLPRRTLFRLVEWPALARVAPGAAGLIFMLSVTSFTIVLTLGGGPAASTLEVAIYQALKFEFDPPRALMLALLQLALTLGIFVVLRLVPDPEEGGSGAAGRPFRPDARPMPARLADAGLIGAFLLFVGAPIAAIALAGLWSGLGGLFGEALFWRALGSSLGISALAGLVALGLGFLAVRAQASAPGSAWNGLLRVPEFLLLVPPLALGSGWFLLMLRWGSDQAMAVTLVVLVNALMALPFVVRVLGPEVRLHLGRTARLALSLDLNGFSRLKIVDWPVLKTPVLTALGFAMALSLGDMAAIALFGSDGLVTLPSLLYARLGSYRSTDAAGLALVLGLVCTLLMLPSLRSETQRVEDMA